MLDGGAVRREMGCATRKTAAASAQRKATCNERERWGDIFMRRDFLGSWEIRKVSKSVGPVHADPESGVRTDSVRS
jgi:hypothetical protein